MNLKDFYAACCTNESPLFRNVIEAVPEDQLDYRPEPKARSARELIGHMIGHEQDIVEALTDGVVHHRNHVPFESLDDALAIFDESHAALEEAVKNASDEDWDRPADFMVGDQAIGTYPTGQMAWMLHFDQIHHRGQLTTYLRPMGSKVPSIYGPSADTAADH